jgi:hypothetical protein
MKSPKTDRRRFLMAAGLGGAGAAAALVARTHAIEAPEKVADAAVRPGGYRVTEHITKYYKTTEA